MKIRTQFILILLFFGLLLAGMVASLIITNQQVERLHQQEEIALRIEQRADELNYLSGDYLMYGESQQRARWEVRFASLSADLAKLKPVNTEQQAIISHINADQKRLRILFTDVASTLEQSAQISGGTPDPAFNQVSWSRMEVQNQSIAFSASQLSHQLRAEAERLRQLSFARIFILIGIFGAYLLSTYYLIDKRTLRSIAELQAGTQIIGSGDLDFTIAVKQMDEVGELSQAFNQMTANLKEVTASKADLEREIIERKRAEQALQEVNEKLQEQAIKMELQAQELQIQKNELVAANEQSRLSEEIGNQRRIEIEAANKELHVARLAALNLMEDALQVQEKLRQINLKLHESEQRLNRAQEIAHLGSWELNLVSNQLSWSDEVYRIFGLQPQEFGATYEAFLGAVHPDDRAAVDAAYSGSIHDGRDQYEIEHRVVRRASGEVRIVHEKCEHFRNEAGQIIRSVGMVHDITERKQAEEALRLSEEKFRSAFANAAIGFAMTRPDGCFVDANPAYCALTGYGIEELQVMEFSSLIYPEDRAENMKLITQMLVGEISGFVVENRYLRKNQEPVWVRKSVSVVRNAENIPQWIIALVEDITKRKQAEEALRRAHDELEVRVEERTKELAAANANLVREITERKEVERQLRIQTTAMEAAANGIIITDDRGFIQWTNPALTQISGYHTQELVGQSTRIFRSGQHDATYYHQMWDTILSGQGWRGETINRHKDGSLYIEEQTITPVRDDDGQIQHFIAIKQDITKRKQDESELERRNVELQIISDAERNQRQFSEALVGAALILNKSLKLNDVLSLILDQIQGVIPYQLANISLLEGDSFYDACHHGALLWPSALMGMNNRFLIDSFPLLTEMRQSGKPILVLDSEKQADWVDIEGMLWIRSLLSAPLLAEQKVMGFVTLFSDQPGFFTAEMSNHLVAFAAHAAVAIQNAWLFEQVQASTDRLQFLSRRLVEIQENERRYISRELHDEAGQVLTSLLVDLRLLEKNISEPAILQKIVTEMESSLNGVIENLHRIAMALRPASLDHVGLVAALRQHTEAVAEKHGLNISFTSSGIVERLPANVETVLYRMVQESLTNIVRHAHATRVDVVLTVRDGKLIVIIEDDGIGFDPEAAPAGSHLGLFGMRERAEMIDAKLMIESSPGIGTTIMMEVGYADTIDSRR
jgi:PAS domain S-box-containing protein